LFIIKILCTKTLNGGKVKHDATLFNLGAVYHLTDAQQMFANFSQGSNLPDIQRMLRDVPASFTVNSQTIDPIKVNNYELGWRVQAANGLNYKPFNYYAFGPDVETEKLGTFVQTDGFGVYNVWNTDYKSVYSQAVESVYGAISSLPAQGRTYGLSYTLKY
jgi:outer membrane receptor protein involved in Fe transport